MSLTSMAPRNSWGKDSNMGARLIYFFEQASKEYGAVGRMKLAMLTKVSSVKAQDETDSAENIKKFEQALAQLRLEPKA